MRFTFLGALLTAVLTTCTAGQLCFSAHEKANIGTTPPPLTITIEFSRAKSEVATSVSALSTAARAVASSTVFRRLVPTTPTFTTFFAESFIPRCSTRGVISYVYSIPLSDGAWAALQSVT